MLHNDGQILFSSLFPFGRLDWSSPPSKPRLPSPFPSDRMMSALSPRALARIETNRLAAMERKHKREESEASECRARRCDPRGADHRHTEVIQRSGESAVRSY